MYCHWNPTINAQAKERARSTIAALLFLVAASYKLLPARQQVLQWLGRVQPQHLGSAGTCTQKHGQGLGYFHCSCSKSRYCVLGSWLLQQIGTQGSMLAALWTQQPEGPQGKIACISAVEVEPSGSANNSVLSERKQSAPQRTLPNGQLWERNTQRLLCRWECSSPTHLTLQLRMDLRAATLTTRRQILTPDTVVKKSCSVSSSVSQHESHLLSIT